MNLTAITDEAEFAVKHFIDSLTLMPWLPAGAKVLDVGTGAGFPGVPLKIARPDIKLTLMDSLRKRIFFLRETVDGLKLEDVTCLHARAEEFIRKPEHKERYDICTARAVARLTGLVGYTLPFVKPGGLLLAMKGADVTDELNEARPVIKKLGGAVTEVKPVEIGMGITHTVVVIGKR
jgi:16S rRNA (guanine527-N7)-methyltransferase